MGTALLLASLGGLAGCGGNGQALPPTTTTLTSSDGSTNDWADTKSDNWSFEGSGVTFTATVRPTNGDGTPTGTVTFMEGSTALGYAPLTSWQATFETSSLSVGSHSFTAVYSGDDNFAASASDVMTRIVYELSTTTFTFTPQQSPPQCGDLWDVWGSSRSDVFAVGEDGTILHYDGSVWSTQPSGTGSFLLGVYGTSSSDIWAVGGYGTILHYNGSAWSTVKALKTVTPEYKRVWAGSPSDVWAGNMHYDGSAWNETTGGGYAIWGRSSSDVYGNATDGVWGANLAHYNGKTWKTMDSAWAAAQDICGSSSDVFALASGTFMRHDGRNWSSNMCGTDLKAIWCCSSSDVFAVGNGGVILDITW
jgi:hypothetical protein